MNLKVRIKNPAFWISFIPALLILVQVVAAVFNIQLDLSAIGEKLLAVVNAVFALLAILGVAVDPTTAGMGDSERAMSYNEPHKD